MSEETHRETSPESHEPGDNHCDNEEELPITKVKIQPKSAKKKRSQAQIDSIKKANAARLKKQRENKIKLQEYEKIVKYGEVVSKTAKVSENEIDYEKLADLVSSKMANLTGTQKVKSEANTERRSFKDFVRSERQISKSPKGKTLIENPKPMKENPPIKSRFSRRGFRDSIENKKEENDYNKGVDKRIGFRRTKRCLK